MTRRKGAPKKSDVDKLSALLSFAVTERDAEFVFSEARRRRLSVSAYIRLRLKDLEFFSKKNTQSQQPV